MRTTFLRRDFWITFSLSFGMLAFIAYAPTARAESCLKLSSAKEQATCLQYERAFSEKACPWVAESEGTPICEIVKSAREANCSKLEISHAKDYGQCLQVEKLLIGGGGAGSAGGGCGSSEVCREMETVFQHPLDEACKNLRGPLVAACIGLRSAYQVNDEQIDEFIKQMTTPACQESSTNQVTNLHEGTQEILSSMADDEDNCPICDEFSCPGCGLGQEEDAQKTPWGHQYKQLFDIHGLKLDHSQKLLNQVYVDLGRFKHMGAPQGYMKQVQDFFLKTVFEQNRTLHTIYTLQRAYHQEKLAYAKYEELTGPVKSTFEALNRRAFKHQSDLALVYNKLGDLQKKRQRLVQQILDEQEAERKRMEDQQFQANLAQELERQAQERERMKDDPAVIKRAELFRKIEEKKRKRQEEEREREAARKK